MSTAPLEDRVTAQLGFYPSYLASLESMPRAADLV